MELEEVSPEIHREVEREARRVAFAIDAEEFHLIDYKTGVFPSTSAHYSGLWDGVKIKWAIVVEGIALQSIVVGDTDHPFPVNACMVYRYPEEGTNPEIVWSPWATLPGQICQTEARFKEHMARTLYRLSIDIDEEEWLAALNVSLTAHEKLELRLTMLREF